MSNSQSRNNRSDLSNLTAEQNLSPNKQFVDSLENRVVEEYSQKSHSILKFNQIFMSRARKVAYAGIGLLTFTALTFGAYQLWFKPAETLDEASILLQIAQAGKKASAQNLADRASSLVAGSAEDADESLTAMTSELYRYSPDGYTKSKIVYTPGPSLSKCTTYDFYSLNQKYVIENETLSVDGTFLSKDSLRLANGDLVTYYLSNKEGSYIYMGGDYAVMYPYIEYETLAREAEAASATLDTVTQDVVDGYSGDEVMPVEEAPIDNETIIKDFFGGESNVIGTEKYNGRDVFVVEYTTDAYCDVSTVVKGDTVTNYDGSPTGKLVTKAWVDQETFDFLKSETYYNSVSANNLIVTEESIISKDLKATVAKYQDSFEFEFNVDVKEIVFPEFENETQLALESAKDDGLKFLMYEPYQLGGFYSSKIWEVANIDFAQDRKFYADNNTGQDMYNRAVEDSRLYGVQSQYSATLYGSDGMSYVSVEYYLENSISEVLDAVNTEGEKSTVSLNIGGSTVSAVLYKLTKDYATGLIPEEMTEANEIYQYDSPGLADFTYYTYIFEYNGVVTVLTSESNISELKVLNLSTAGVIDDLLAMIDEYQGNMDDGVGIDGNEGSSDGGYTAL